MSDRESSQESGKNSNDGDTLRQNLADDIQSILPIIDSSSPTSNGEPKSDEEQDQRIKHLVDLITDNLVIVKPDIDVTSEQMGYHGQVLFDWDKFFEEKYYAELASPIYRYPTLTLALNEVGDIFEKANCNCLNKKTWHFRLKLKNVGQFDDFVRAVAEEIKVLPIPGIDDFLNINGIIMAISDCIKACLQCGNTKGKSYERFAMPIILENQMAWVKYEFFSEQVIITKCINKKRVVELETIATFFCFPDEMRFRLSLVQAYRIIRKQQTENL